MQTLQRAIIRPWYDGCTVIDLPKHELPICAPYLMDLKTVKLGRPNNMFVV